MEALGKSLLTRKQLREIVNKYCTRRIQRKSIERKCCWHVTEMFCSAVITMDWELIVILQTLNALKHLKQLLQSFQCFPGHRKCSGMTWGTADRRVRLVLFRNSIFRELANTVMPRAMVMCLGHAALLNFGVEVRRNLTYNEHTIAGLPHVECEEYQCTFRGMTNGSALGSQLSAKNRNWCFQKISLQRRRIRKDMRER